MLLTKQHLVNTVDERWKKQYYIDSSWDYYGEDKVKKYEQLVSLGKNKNPEMLIKLLVILLGQGLLAITAIKMLM